MRLDENKLIIKNTLETPFTYEIDMFPILFIYFVLNLASYWYIKLELSRIKLLPNLFLLGALDKSPLQFRLRAYGSLSITSKVNVNFGNLYSATIQAYLLLFDQPVKRMLTDYQNIEVWYRYFSLFMKAYGGRLEVFCRLGFNANCYSSVRTFNNKLSKISSSQSCLTNHICNGLRKLILNMQH